MAVPTGESRGCAREASAKGEQECTEMQCCGLDGLVGIAGVDWRTAIELFATYRYRVA